MRIFDLEYSDGKRFSQAFLYATRDGSSPSAKARTVPSVTISRGRRCSAGRSRRSGIGGGFDCDGKVGIVKDDHRALAAHIELELAVMLYGGERDTFASAGRAGKRDAGKVRAVEHRLADDRAAAHARFKTPFGRQAWCRISTIAQPQHEVGRLENDRKEQGETWRIERDLTRTASLKLAAIQFCTGPILMVGTGTITIRTPSVMTDLGMQTQSRLEAAYNWVLGLGFERRWCINGF